MSLTRSATAPAPTGDFVSQLIRGIVWRRSQALTLVALGTAVVAGCLVAVTFSELTNTPVGSAGVLLLLGAVALTVQAAAASRSRRTEIALAQIRGRHGLRLFAYFLAEPVALLLLATALGVLAGRWVVSTAAEAWLGTGADAATVEVSGLGWSAVAAASIVGVAAVVAGSWRTVREPLIQQLDDARRPAPATTLLLFGQILVLVAALIAGYQAATGTSARDSWAGLANPALLSPVLLGLAAGQVAAWSLRLAASRAASRPATATRLSSFLAIRRLGRRADTAMGTRLVIAAAVVAAVTANATAAVAAWQVETTKLDLGGAQRFTVEAGALAAYEVSHTVDPGGQWLMAMVSFPDESEPYRRVFADTERWESVVGPFLAGTGAATVSEHVQQLATGERIRVATGPRVSATFDTASARALRGERLTISYVTDTGGVELLVLAPKDSLLEPGSTTVSARLRECDGGCVVNELLLDGLRRPGQAGALTITSIDFGGVELLEEGNWREQDAVPHLHGAAQRGGTLRVHFPRYGETIVLTAGTSQPEQVAIATPGFRPNREAKAPIAYSVDGSEHPVSIVGTAGSLPLVGQQGMLLDLSRALTFGANTAAAATSYVVARDDTPAAVIDRLRATGAVARPQSFASLLTQAEQRTDAQGARLYTLISAFAAIIAVIGLAAAVSGQRRERQREAASLRVTGVGSEHIAAAYRVEAGWLAACTLLVVGVAGWVAARVTVQGLSLVPESAYSPPLTAQPNVGLLFAVAAGAAALVGVLTLTLNRRVVAGSPPSVLREGGL